MDTSKLQGRQFRSQQELAQALRALYEEDRQEYIKQCADSKQFRILAENDHIILQDCIQEAGTLDTHYFIQDIYVAKRVHEAGISHIYDIGSRVDGYIAHLLSMNIQVTMLDIRPLKQTINGLDFIQTDAMDMSNIKNNSMQSVSSLHAMEHFGLGRYGDPINYNGWKKFLQTIKNKIQINGTLYLSVPVGRDEKVMFNAHRIFNPMSIIEVLMPELVLLEFGFIQNFQLYNYVHKTDNFSFLREIIKNRLGLYDCGIFIFKKIFNTPPLSTD